MIKTNNTPLHLSVLRAEILKAKELLCQMSLAGFSMSINLHWVPEEIAKEFWVVSGESSDGNPIYTVSPDEKNKYNSITIFVAKF